MAEGEGEVRDTGSHTGSHTGSYAGTGKLRGIKGLLEETKGNIALNLLYYPLKSLKGTDLTLEIFLELINKTDWLFRQTVSALEKKAPEEAPMSHRQKWLKAKMLEKLEEDRKANRIIRTNLL